MARFSRVQAVWMSFYSADLYRDVAANWKGIGALYLLMLLVVTWVPSAVRWSGGVRRFVTAEAPKVLAEMPVIRIERGVMRAEPPGRHVIRDPSDPTGPPIIVIDDTIDRVPLEHDERGAYLTRREFVMIQRSRADRRVYPLGPTTDLVITREKIERFLAVLPVWIPVLGYVFAVLGSWLFRIGQTCAYGVIGGLFARGAGNPPPYQTLVRLAAVAVTPVILARTLLWFAAGEPAWYIRWPIALLISLAYLRFAVRSVAATASPVPVPTPASGGA